MYLLILITIELTYLLTEANEWDSAHSYYKREAKIAPQYNLKVRKTDQLKQLNFIYSSNCIVGGIILAGVAELINFLINIKVFPVIISIIMLVSLTLTCIITNIATTTLDNMYDEHLHALTIIKSQKPK